MAGDAKQKARADVREAQSEFESAGGQYEKTREARRKSFERARKAGLTIREIGEAAGLHWTRVARVLRNPK